MVIPGLEDDSVFARRSNSAIREQSMLRSEYETSFTQPSATVSQIIIEAGAAFDNDHNDFLVQPLRLNPDCRHGINLSDCTQCMQ